MGFLRWIKQDRKIDTPISCRNRQSEQPPIPDEDSSVRDEAYIKALSKFNDWRRRQRFGSFRKLSRKQSNRAIDKKTKLQNLDLKTVQQNSTIKNANGTNSNSHTHIYEELETPNSSKFENVANANYSLRNRKHGENFTRTNTNVTRIIYENDISCVHPCTFDRQELKWNKEGNNPSIHFFKQNANVESPKKELKQFPILKSCLKRRNFTDYDPDDLLAQPNRISKFKKGIEIQTTRDYLDTTSTYQSVVNKNGDIVEYDLPFSDSNNMGEENKLRNSIPDLRNSQEICPENLNFVEASSEAYVNGEQIRLNLYPKNELNVVVTDLDKSECTPETCTEIHQSNNNIFRELHCLEKWTERIKFEEMGRPSILSCDNIKDHKIDIIVCSKKDLKYCHSSLRTTLNLPIELCSGIFRKTRVSMQKVFQQPKKMFGYEALHRNFFILSKIRHPNVVLLMAICLKEKEEKIESLIMEPFKYSLHQFMYEFDNIIPVKDCIAYILQISNAIIYIHEFGFIHSNISSHNVFFCQYKKCVKLSSFELATEIISDDIRKDIILNYDKTSPGKSGISKPVDNTGQFHSKHINNENSISLMILPYMIDYRKNFSQHFYQSPELLTKTEKFVIPTKQADVYGLTLLLWEMLNHCVPIAIFNYKEMEKFFGVKQEELPIFEKEKCEKFQKLFESGLEINPIQRIPNVEVFWNFLGTIRSVYFMDLNFNDNNSTINNLDESVIPKNTTINNFETLFNPETRSDRFGRTSTLKKPKRKTLKSSRNCIAKELFPLNDKNININMEVESKNLKSLIENDIHMAFSENCNKNDYEFNKVPIPKTPEIERATFLTKNSILTEKNSAKLSHDKTIQETEEREALILNSSTKKYNVTIRIIKSNTFDSSQLSRNSLNISPQIEYFNNISGHKTVVQKNVSRKEMRFVNNSEENKHMEKSNRRQNLGKRIDFSSEILTATFPRKHKSIDEDNDDQFENVLWKREKEKCEKVSPRSLVVTPNRSSVKETVCKFESFSKIGDSEPVLYEKRTIVNRNDKIVESGQNISNYDLPVVEINQNEIELCENLSDNNISKLDIILKNNEKNKIKKSKMNSDYNENNGGDNISKLDITLNNNLEKGYRKETNNDQQSIKIVSLNKTVFAASSKDMIEKNNPLLKKIYLRKLNRRASDVGSLTKNKLKIDQNLRHSICGTELIQTLKDMAFKDTKKTEEILPKKTNKIVENLSSKTEGIAQLTCWKCSSIVDDVIEIEGNVGNIEQLKTDINTMKLTKSFKDFQETKSTEDFYIDDDC